MERPGLNEATAGCFNSALARRQAGWTLSGQPKPQENMKRTLLIIAASLALAGAARAAEAAWQTDLNQALAKAKMDKKHVLVDFTGSDW